VSSVFAPRLLIPDAIVSAPIALIAHPRPDSIFAYREGRPISAGRFLAEAMQLAARLPAVPVLNVCSDRYHFAVGLAAAALAGTLSLLPPTHTPEVIRFLRAAMPDALCLTDSDDCPIDLPQLRFPEDGPDSSERWPPPEIPAAQPIADVFTSGSTGTPVPHRKHWAHLVSCVRIEAQRLGIDAASERLPTLVATVPAQHMYGLETSVLLAMQSGAPLCAEHPFFPADICSTLAMTPEPRVLVSTPIHLRALLASSMPIPRLTMVLSATAPLDEQLAREVESQLGVPLLEIYGSTETGQIASRRPTRARSWQLWDGVQLEQHDERTWASGGHVETPTQLGDQLELIDRHSFELGARLQDVVNIAGKRNSIAYLNHQLLAIAGVSDGAFFLPQQDDGHGSRTVRLCAAVVAPGLDAATVLQHLRERVDPVFLPRPLLMLKALPRTSTGKLPLHALRALLGQSDGGTGSCG
jgi:acyl-coenzyme A synthetase/AMP-(fatty) acid ligase